MQTYDKSIKCACHPELVCPRAKEPCEITSGSRLKVAICDLRTELDANMTIVQVWIVSHFLLREI